MKPMQISAVAGAALCYAAAVMAQSQPPSRLAPGGGVVQTATLTSSLMADDNYNLSRKASGNALLWTNTANFGLVSTTPRDVFSASASGDLRYADLPVVGDTTDLDNGTIRINYSRAVDDDALSFGFFANDADIEYLDPLASIDSNGDFDDTLGQGRRNLTTGQAQLSLDQNGPLSMSFGANFRQTDYRDTTDPTLYDQQSGRLTTSVGLDLSPGYRFVVDGTYFKQDTDPPGVDRESYSAQAGLNIQVSPTALFSSRVGYSEANRTKSGKSLSSQHGVIGQLGYDITRPNGMISLKADSTVNTNGQRNSYSIARQLSLPAGSFSGEVGFTNSHSTDVQPLVNLSYSILRPTQVFDVGLKEAVFVDSNGRDVLSSVLHLGFKQQVNSLSSFGLTGDAARREYLSSNASQQDVTRLTVSAQYNRQITQDWQMSTGMRHRQRDVSGGSNSQSNAVFFNVSRQFVARR